MNRHRLAGLLLAVALASAGATVAMHVVNRGVDLGVVWPDQPGLLWLVNVLSAVIWSVPGWFLATRRPAVVYGWLALAAGIGHGLGGLGLEGALASQVGGHSVPWPAFGLWIAAWGPLVEQPVLMVMYGMFPDGRLPRDRTRLAVIVSIVLATAGTVQVALARFPAKGAVVPALSRLANPVSVPGASAAPDSVVPYFALSALLAIVVLVVRWRRAEGEEQRVLSWLVAVGVPVTVTVPIAVVVLPAGIGVTYALATTLLEVAVIVTATLRHRVYGIDVVLNRTLVFGAATTVIAVVYGVVIGLSALIGAESTAVVSFVGALAAGLLLAPARTRIQRAVNHLLYGERDDPYVVLSRVAAGLEAAGSGEQLLPGLVAVMASTLRLPFVAVEFETAHGTRRVIHGVEGGPTSRVPLVHQGRGFGALVVGLRPGQHTLSTRERRILGDLARQTAVAVANVILADDLRRSREQIVAAREEERRRLHLDLHDSLGPQLTGIALGLDIVAEAATDSLPCVAADAERLRGEVNDAIEDVRRLVQGLRPPRLDEIGIVGALREAADRIGRGDLSVRVDAPADLPPLPAALEVAAYRIATEALTNAVRHANASTCVVSLQVDGDLRLSIVDDGRGLRGTIAGTGRTSMRERAEEVGGTCTIIDADPAGCRVDAWLPRTTQ